VIGGTLGSAEAAIPGIAAVAESGALLDALPQLVWIADRDGRLNYVNRRWSTYTGLDASQAHGTGWLKLLHPDDCNALIVRLQEAAAAAEPYQLEARVRRADGLFRWMLMHGTPLLDADGTTRLWVGTCTDIDDRKTAEAAQNLAQSRLQLLIDADMLGVFRTDLQGRFFDANDTFLRMIGYERADVEAGCIRWQDLTPPEFMDASQEAARKAYTAGMCSSFEKEYVKKDGTRIPILIGAARIPGTDEVIGYVLDLTERKRAETARHESETRLRRLVDANVIGVFTADRTHAIAEANDAFLRMIGYRQEDVAAGLLSLSELTPPEWSVATARAFDEVRATGVCTPFEKEYYRKDGSRVPVLVGAARIPGADDNEICYALDLTSQKRATQALRESEARYRILAEALPQLVWIVDPEGDTLYANRHCHEYLGGLLPQTREDWNGVVHVEDRARLERTWSSYERCELELRLRRGGDGSYRWHLMRYEPICDALGTLVRWLGTAIDIDDRKRAEDGLRFVARASEALSRSLDLATTLDVLLELLVPALGDWAAINVREDAEHIRTLAVRHRDPAKKPFVDRLRGACYHDTGVDGGTPEVYRTGRPAIVQHVLEDVRSAVRPEYWDAVEGCGLGSGMSIPIAVAGRVIGTLVIVSVESRKAFSQADLPLLQELAVRAGLAIENAQLYEREHRVAWALQSASLPASLPRVPGLAFCGYYEAGKGEALIGGDWYDALRLPDGRVMVSIGDVAGSGLEAAVRMTKMRQVIRGTALMLADPMTILDAADRAFRSECESGFVTAFVGLLDPVEFTFTYASAGHLPPLLRHSDGRVERLEGGLGAPLGLRARNRTASPGACRLPAGSLLVLYTDGLIEATRNFDEGNRRLFEALQHEPSPDGDVAAALAGAVLSPGGPRDDVAILTIAAAPGAAKREVDALIERWTFDTADAGAAQRLRRTICTRLESLRASAAELYAAELVFGELAANAARFAPGSVDVALDLSTPLPVLHVLDGGSAFSARGVLPADELAERGRGLFIVEKLTEDFQISARPGFGNHARAVLSLRGAPRARAS
jgi:PAS domain S-box-containing protein